MLIKSLPNGQLFKDVILGRLMLALRDYLEAQPVLQRAVSAAQRDQNDYLRRGCNRRPFRGLLMLLQTLIAPKLKVCVGVDGSRLEVMCGRVGLLSGNLINVYRILVRIVILKFKQDEMLCTFCVPRHFPIIIIVQQIAKRVKHLASPLMNVDRVLLIRLQALRDYHLLIIYQCNNIASLLRLAVINLSSIYIPCLNSSKP